MKTDVRNEGLDVFLRFLQCISIATLALRFCTHLIKESEGVHALVGSCKRVQRVVLAGGLVLRIKRKECIVIRSLEKLVALPTLVVAACHGRCNNVLEFQAPTGRGQYMRADTRK